jgi:hypothetical protein
MILAYLFAVYILFPISAILILLWLVTRRKMWIKAFVYIWSSIIFVAFLMYTIHWITKKTEPNIDAIRGKYVIDRNQFPGKQADWQYDHFQFEITDDDSFIFYETEKDKIVRTYRGKIEYSEYDNTPKIRLVFNGQRHHIIADNPTLYRNTWSFYYVFHSEKFNNVFFKKGEWEAHD